MHWLPRGGAGKILIKKKSLKAWVAKKGEEGGGCEENFDKKNVVIRIIESTGCQVGGGGGRVSESGVVSESVVVSESG